MVSPSTEPHALFQATSPFQRIVITPLKLVFDAIWHVLAFLVGVVVIGGILVNVIISLATNGSTGLTNPQTWAIARPIVDYPLYGVVGLAVIVVIVLCSYLAHRASHRSGEAFPESIRDEFGLSMVQQAIPTSTMIPFYRPVYIPRRLKGSGSDADAQARNILSAAATRRDGSQLVGDVGICVIGRKLLGTTRCAWEAMKADHDLDKWVFVRWPDEPRQYVELWEGLKHHRAKVVLWLDDLSKYRDDRTASLIARLPYDLEERHIPFVILATLPDNAAAAEAHKRFGGLLDHLAQLPLADLSLSEARALAAELTKAGDTVTVGDRFDGTPGSIVLAVNRMLEEIYPRLPEKAKLILRTMKLLRSTGIRDYTLERVLGTTTALFAPGTKDWTRELEALRTAGFVRQTVVDNGRLVLLEPVTEVYLDVAVPDYAGPNDAKADWPRLQGSLIEADDAPSLVRLGDAFRKSGEDTPAETCYQAALERLTRATAEQDWARAQFGLGDILARRVDNAEPAQRLKFLEDAEQAFKNALQIVTRESDPTFWAEIQGRLAGVIRHEATTTQGPKKRVAMLDSAATNCREALKILRRETAPKEWAEAQLNLGLVLLTHAQFVEPGARRRMLDGSLDALSAALSIFTQESSPSNWARGKRYLGDASRVRAEVSIRPKKDDLFRQAIAAYTDTLGHSAPPMMWTQATIAEIYIWLGKCARELGKLEDGSTRESQLVQATEAFQSAANLYATLDIKDQPITAYRELSAVYNERAHFANSASRTDLLDLAIKANIDTFTQLGHSGSRELRAQIRLDLARLYWERSTSTGPNPSAGACADMIEVTKYSDQALAFFTKENSPAEYKLASRLQRDAKAKAKELGCASSVATVPARPGSAIASEQSD